MQPNMRFTANHSQMSRIIDSLSNNRITDFQAEGANSTLKPANAKGTTLINTTKSLFGKNLSNPNSLSPQRKYGASFKSTSSNLKNSYGGYTSQSQKSFKDTVNAKEVNQLRMSLPSKSIGQLVKGKEVRPELHQKTYFKATASVYIQNSPHLPTSIEKFRKTQNKPIKGKDETLNLLSNYPAELFEKREGKQAYDYQFDGTQTNYATRTQSNFLSNKNILTTLPKVDKAFRKLIDN